MLQAVENSKRRSQKARVKPAKSLADDIFRQLQKEGCDSREMIKVSSHLLGLVTNNIQAKQNK